MSCLLLLVHVTCLFAGQLGTHLDEDGRRVGVKHVMITHDGSSAARTHLMRRNPQAASSSEVQKSNQVVPFLNLTDSSTLIQLLGDSFPPPTSATRGTDASIAGRIQARSLPGELAGWLSGQARWVAGQVGWVTETSAGLVCTEALQQQEKSNKVLSIKAYNLMNLPMLLTGFPIGSYTSMDSIQPMHLERVEQIPDARTDSMYTVPDSHRSCPQKMQKNIHFIWFGLWMPDENENNILRTASVNPTWTVMLWTTQPGVDALQQHLNSKLIKPNIIVKSTPDYYESFRNGNIIKAHENPAGKSSWMRLEVVYKFGGIYLDTDTISYKPFDEFGSRFQWPFVVFDDRGWYRNLCNCVFGQEAGSKFLLYAINTMESIGVKSEEGLYCGILTGAFVHYNMTGIQMLSSNNMLHHSNEVSVQTQTFAASWQGDEWKKYSAAKGVEAMVSMPAGHSAG